MKDCKASEILYQKWILIVFCVFIFNNNEYVLSFINDIYNPKLSQVQEIRWEGWSNELTVRLSHLKNLKINRVIIKRIRTSQIRTLKYLLSKLKIVKNKDDKPKKNYINIS
jgi:hypothetical protein